MANRRIASPAEDLRDRAARAYDGAVTDGDPGPTHTSLAIQTCSPIFMGRSRIGTKPLRSRDPQRTGMTSANDAVRANRNATKL